MSAKRWYKSTRQITEKDLKVGLEVVARWNKETSTIVEIKDGRVHYKCSSFRPDTIYTDEISVFLECFSIEISIVLI
jgi:hypothetical protein